MNYYSHHIGDYRRDTAHLSLLEHGVYRQLLDMYYLSETKIPEETEVVYRRLCARTDEEKKAVDTVLSEFFRLENGWIQTRCDKEIAEYHGKAGRARENGKLGGRPSKTNVVISDNPEITKEKANHKPITNNHKPITNKKPSAEYSAEFEQAWSDYPKRPGASKKDSFKAWSARLKSGVSADVMLEGVQRYAAFCSAQQTEPQFIKQPVTFFGNGDHYLADWTSKPTQKRGTPSVENFHDRDYGEGITKL